MLIIYQILNVLFLNYLNSYTVLIELKQVQVGHVTFDYHIIQRVPQSCKCLEANLKLYSLNLYSVTELKVIEELP